MKIISWNVNGISSLIKGGFFNEIFSTKPDILCLQEVKSDSVPDVEGYDSYLFSSTKRGSGVCIYTKIPPQKVKNGFGVSKFDSEGRFQRMEFEDFTLMNSYFPSGANSERLEHKFEYYDHVTKIIIKSFKPVILCGDFNRISAEADAKDVRKIRNRPGFLKEEKEWFEDILSSDFTDAFRLFNKEGGNFTWWPYAYNSRAKNNGLRLDYFLISSKIANVCSDSYILSKQMGSDHAPIVLELNSCQACDYLNYKSNEYCYHCGTKLIDDVEEQISHKKI